MNRYEEVVVRPEVPVVVEQGPASWGAFAPSVPQVAVVGRSRDEAIQLITESISFALRDSHREALAKDACEAGDSELDGLAREANETMTLDEAATLAGVGLSAITNAIRAGRLTAIIAPSEARPPRGHRTRLVYRQ